MISSEPAVVEKLFAVRLLSTVNNDAFCAAVVRDWQWYLGRELSPMDFDVRYMGIYLASLREELSAARLNMLAFALETLWHNGYEAGLIGSKPMDVVSFS